MNIQAQAVDNRPLKAFIENNKGRTTFLEHEVKGLLKEVGLQVPKGIFVDKDLIAGGCGAAVSLLESLSYPLIAQVSSETITSKSDVHGIVPSIGDEDGLIRALTELSRIGQAAGVLVEEMAPQGVEVIVGGIIDRQFGPVVMFGLGGIFVELFKDVSFGLAPLSEEDALRLIREVKGYRLLAGYRGSPAVDIGSLLHVIVKVSELTATGLIEEIDLNPVAVYSEGAMVLDAKMSASRK
jgi:acyl-CoA synthetase (NDP forming)